MSPASKTVLITGCSAGGIGAFIADSLIKRDHHVFATARNPSKIPSHLRDSPHVSVLELDITSHSSIAAAVAKVAGSSRQLDVLVNNAGAGYVRPILDIDIDAAQKLYDTNVWGPIRMMQGFADLLIASRGRIVNMSTCAAPMNVPWISSYISSKAALTTYSETLRHELAPFGVDVTTIMTGTVASHFHDNDPLTLPSGSRYGPIEKIIQGHATGEAGPTPMPAADFAEKIVGDIVGDKSRGLVWKGPNSSSMGAIFHHGPQFLCDTVTSYGQGLKELKETVDESQRQTLEEQVA